MVWDMPRGQALLALAFLCGLTVAQFWPIARDLPRAVVDGHGDVALNMWALSDLSDSLGRRPLRPFDGRIFHPYPNSLASVDHMITNAVVGAPLRLFGVGPVAVYNTVFLLTFILSGFFTYLLVRQLTGSAIGGLVAGCAFAFGTFRSTYVVHLHLLSTQWLPLAFLALHRYVESPGRRRFGVLAASGLLVALSSWHIALIASVGLAVVAAVLVAADDRDRSPRLGGLVAASLLVAICLLPIAQVYHDVLTNWTHPIVGEGPLERERLRGSTTLDGLVNPSDRNRSLFEAVLPDAAHGEARAFPGVVVLVLVLLGVCRRGMRGAPAGPTTWLLRALLGLSFVLVTLQVASILLPGWPPWLVAWIGRLGPVRLFGVAVLALGLGRARWLRNEPPAIIAGYAYGLMAVIGLLLSLGPRVALRDVELGAGLDFLFRLPVYEALRTPARFSLLLSFGAAVLAGIGVARVQRHLGGVRGVVGASLLLAVLMLDVRLHPVAIVRAPNRAAVHRWLSEHPVPGAVVEYPEANNPWAILASLDYGRRIVNGTSYVWPPTLRLGDRDALSTRQLELLWQELHPRFVVLRAAFFPPPLREGVERAVGSRPDALRLVEEFGAGDALYELIDRGRGNRLVRRWPAAALGKSRGVLLNASLSDIPASRVGLLALRLNGRRLASWTPDGRQRFVPFDQTATTEGINTFELQGLYRLPHGAATHAIGTTGTGLPVDVLVRSSADRSRMTVGGEGFAVDKGYLLLVLDPQSGEVLESGSFNTSWYRDASTALVRFVARIPTGSPVVLASEYDVSRHLTPEAVASLRSLGLAGDLRGRFRWAHAAVGVKGAPPGSAAEVTGPDEAVIEMGDVAAPVIQLDGLRLE